VDSVVPIDAAGEAVDAAINASKTGGPEA